VSERTKKKAGGRKRLINSKGIEGLRVQTRIHLGGKNEGEGWRRRGRRRRRRVNSLLILVLLLFRELVENPPSD